MRGTWAILIPLAAALAAGAVRGEDRGVPGGDAPRWFRGNLHTHSLWSDGNDYPEMIVDWYARRGYHFVALSDHNTLAQGPRWMGVAEAEKRSGGRGLARYRERFGPHWVETRTEAGVEQVRLKPLGEYRTLFEQPGRFLVVQGEEITDTFRSKPIHMNATNVVEHVEPRGGASVPEVMERNLDAVAEQARRLGLRILTHLNHPNFGYAITAEELAMVTKERFFEVYNGHPGVHHEGDATHAPVERMWDIINTIRLGEMAAAPVYGLGTDDSHHYFGRDGSTPGRGWIGVRSRFLTPEHLVAAIEAGDFYASSGVDLDDVRYDREARTLTVTVAPRPGASYTTRFVGTRRGYDRTRRPVTDADGKALPVTGRYSDDVGRVLATVEGTTATYRLAGDELYVRAVVTSSEPPENPSFAGQKAQAWTQPVGWEAAPAPDAGAPGVTATTARPDDRATAAAGPATPGGAPSVVVRIGSPRGIGAATIARVGDRWPDRLVLRLDLKGLESLRLRAGGLTLDAAGTAAGRSASRLARVHADGRSEDLARPSPLWTEVRALRADGSPATSVPLPDGGFEVAIPAGLLAGNPPELAVEWVDFHR
jgi:hypothetical protein